MSSDSEASSNPEEVANVTHRLNATRTPFIVAALVELAFCILVTLWIQDDGGYTVFFRIHDEKIGSKSIIVFVWCVFAVSILVRLWCLCVGAKSIHMRRAGRWQTVIYMFFGSVNWLLYLTAYYVAHDMTSAIKRSHKVQMDLTEKNHLFQSPTFEGDVNLCLLHNDWKYEACDLQVHSACTKPFDEKKDYARGECVATVNMDGVPCCISEALKIDKPRFNILGRPVKVGILFMLLKWMAILLVGWVLRHGFYAADVGTPDFSKTAYLDILDAVIFSENLNEDAVRCPAYGFTADGVPSEKNRNLYYYLYATFATAFGTVLLAQMIYTLFVPRREDDEDKLEQVVVSPSAAAKEIRPPKVQVTLHDQEVSSFLDQTSNLLNFGANGSRPATITRRDSPGMYWVKFLDALEPSEMLVPIDEMVFDAMRWQVEGQDADEAPSARPPACSGWLNTSELSRGSHVERFDKKAQVIDALRSLLCLNLPFLVWRLWFDSFQVDLLLFAGRTMLIAKNVIWSLLDLVKLLACLRSDAKICGWSPMDAMRTAASGHFGQVWVGPSGMVATVAEWGGQIRTKSLQISKKRLEEYYEWLVAERKAVKASTETAIYDRKLEEVQLQLDVLDEKLLFTFP